MRVSPRKPSFTSRYGEMMRLLVVAAVTALFVVGLGFVGSYAGASVACAASLAAVGIGRPLRQEIRDVRAHDVRVGDDVVLLGRCLPVLAVWRDDEYVEITVQREDGRRTEGYDAQDRVTVRRNRTASGSDDAGVVPA